MPQKIKNLKKKPSVQHKKRPLKQVKKQQQQQQQPQAERRDSSYGAPAPPRRQVIIKQAGNHSNSRVIPFKVLNDTRNQDLWSCSRIRDVALWDKLKIDLERQGVG